MTPARMAELRVLDAAATPGPWSIVITKTEKTVIGGDERQIAIWSCDEEMESLAKRDPGNSEYYRREKILETADARFIAAARTALPEALDALERVRAALESTDSVEGSLGLSERALAALEGPKP